MTEVTIRSKTKQIQLNAMYKKVLIFKVKHKI